MSRESNPGDEFPTLEFASFWAWVITHPNCVLRAGTRDSVIYDDEDYHWHFAVEGTETHAVQVIRGKRLVGELFIAPEMISFVQASDGDRDGEFFFELVSESGSVPETVCYFVLSHGYEVEDPEPISRVH